MDDFPVIMKAFVGYATEEVNGVHSVDIHKDYQHLNLVGVDFGSNIATSIIEDPDHLGFGKIV